MGPPTGGGGGGKPPSTPLVPREESPSVRSRPQQPTPSQHRPPQMPHQYSHPQELTPSFVPDDSDDDDTRDSTDGRPTHVNVDIHYQEQVNESTPNIFTSFVVNRMENDGYDVPSELRGRRSHNNEREVARVLQRIGDEMSNHRQLNHLLQGMRVTPDTAYKTFFTVASEIFADGQINWGRICTLFYFAYKLAIQVLNQLPLVDIIINWVTKFVAQRLASWIWNRGGWVSALSEYGATSKQMICVFLAGFALSSLMWYLKK